MSAVRSERIADSTVACWHCGESVPSGVVINARIGDKPRPMCCHGCQAVARLIDSAGLNRYYDFRDALPDRPDSSSDRAEDFAAWDRSAVLSHYASALPDGRYRLSMVLENVHCAACAWLIQRFLSPLPGLSDIQVDIADGRAQLTFAPEETALSKIAARLSSLGYRPHLDAPKASDDRNREERRNMLKALLVAGLGMMQVMSYALAGYVGAWQGIDHQTERFFQVISMIVAVPVALYAGRLFYQSAWRTLSNGRMGMDVPVAAAMLLALFSSIVITLLDAGEAYFDSVVMFIFFLLLGRYAVLVTRQKAGQLHSALARSLPAQARRLGSSGPEWVSLVELEAGDRIQITSGDTVPADGRIESGHVMVDEALLSGESIPRRRREGESVLAGSLVREGQMVLVIEQVGQGTTLSAIVGLLDQTRRFRPRLARLADRLASWFVVFVLSGALLAGLFWWWQDPSQVLPVVLAVLVVSCPCALALGTPVALAAATRGLARLGILIHHPDSLEVLPQISHVVLDKTGTLTRPDMRLANILPVASIAPERARLLAARLERISRHPVANAFSRHDDGGAVEQPETIAGSGVTGRIEGVDYCLGKPGFVGQWLDATPVEPGPGQWIALIDQHRLLAWFQIESPLRDGADALIRQLKKDGKTLILASGDRSENVERTAHQLGIDQYHGDCSPQFKLELVHGLQASGARVAMIGDGINDAPVLAGADVSLALAEGADIARTQADLVITGKGLDQIAAALSLAPRIRRIIRQNLAWALAYNLTAMPFAATGLIPPWAAAIGMSASSLLVVLNAQRLGRIG